jgi:hypothetical protein
MTKGGLATREMKLCTYVFRTNFKTFNLNRNCIKCTHFYPERLFSIRIEPAKIPDQDPQHCVAYIGSFLFFVFLVTLAHIFFNFAPLRLTLSIKLLVPTDTRICIIALTVRRSNHTVKVHPHNQLRLCKYYLLDVHLYFYLSSFPPFLCLCCPPPPSLNFPPPPHPGNNNT